MKRTLLSFFGLLCATMLVAQVPANYYDRAAGKKGFELKTALWEIIKGHTQVSYDRLPTVYADADTRPDGTVYDMYSVKQNYTLDDMNAGNSAEGKGLNKEHSFPKSWFGGKVSPMYSDAFHVVPTDAYINNMRSNLPYGETDSPTKTSINAFSKKGPCSVPGYTGDIFEPNDEYKGDFARIYFYMATRYEDLIANWDSPMLAGKNLSTTERKQTPYAAWAMRMLLRWAAEDPVSQREIERNNGVYKHQHNRNPFVDFPGLEQLIWGSRTEEAFNPHDFTGGGGVDENTPAQPVFSVASGIVISGTEVTISTTTAGANIQYSLNGGTMQSASSPVTLTIEATTSVTARAEKNGYYSAYVTASYTVRKSQTDDEEVRIFNRVTSSQDLIPGRSYLIVCEAASAALSAQGSAIRSQVPVTIENGIIETKTGTDDTPHVLTLGGQMGQWTLFDEVENVYLALTSDDNRLHTSKTTEANTAKWSITPTSSATEIQSNAYPDRIIQYNAGHPRFACYTGSQKSVILYLQEEVTPQPALDAPEFSVESGEVEAGTILTLTSSSPDPVTIHYSINGGAEQQAAPPISITLSENTSIEAYVELDGQVSETVRAEYTIQTSVVPTPVTVHYVVVDEEGNELASLEEAVDDGTEISGLPSALMRPYTQYDLPNAPFVAVAGKDNIYSAVAKFEIPFPANVTGQEGCCFLLTENAEGRIYHALTPYDADGYGTVLYSESTIAVDAAAEADLTDMRNWYTTLNEALILANPEYANLYGLNRSLYDTYYWQIAGDPYAGFTIRNVSNGASIVVNADAFYACGDAEAEGTRFEILPEESFQTEGYGAGNALSRRVTEGMRGYYLRSADGYMSLHDWGTFVTATETTSAKRLYIVPVDWDVRQELYDEYQEAQEYIRELVGIHQPNANMSSRHHIYDLQGRRLSAPRRGVNIIGSKKVFVR